MVCVVRSVVDMSPTMPHHLRIRCRIGGSANGALAEFSRVA